MKIVLIVPYFGKFPSYFQLFLKSCEYNPDFEWFFFTDNTNKYVLPKNVTFFHLSFDELRRKFENKLGHKIVLKRPHKICDYRGAFGYIFSEYIKEFDFWGHCDIDVIYGTLNKFITPEILSDYDKIYGLGHFSLYKNTNEINTLYAKSLYDKKIFLKISSEDKGYAFDEWHCTLGGINQLFDFYGKKIFEKSHCADLYSESFHFKLTKYNKEQNTYSLEGDWKQIFTWERGQIIRYFLQNGSIRKNEYAYIHFHKREMTMYDFANQNSFIIIPNRIIPFDDTIINASFIKRYSRKRLIDSQYFKVKFNNLRYLLKQYFLNR